MPPVISIIGNSKSGKTTLIEKLIKELKSRGYRVATMKHAGEGVVFDDPAKDSSRHIKAGSEATAICDREKMVFIKPMAAEVTLEEAVAVFGEDYDIILTEGFKQGNAAKIEVHRKESGPLLTDIKRLLAVATDEPVETRARQLPLDDVKGLADLLEDGFIKPQRERLSLYVNDAPVVLSSFPKDFISGLLVAMVSSLKGVKGVSRLKFFLNKGE